MKHFYSSAVLLWLAANPNAARADDCAAPCVSYEFSTELEAGWDLSAGSPLDREPKIDASLFFIPAENILFATSLVTEPVSGQQLGTYVEKLYTEIDIEPVTLTIGKFEPVQSWASAFLPGVRATDIAGELDTEERWGLSARYDFAAAGFDQSLTASLFTTDRSILGGSFFTDRGRTHLSDGGAGNTEGPASASIFLDGCRGAAPDECYDEGDFGFRLGARYQKAGKPTAHQIEDGIGPRDEYGAIASATGQIAFPGDVTLKLLGEAAWLANFDDGDGDALIATLSAAAVKDDWTLAATYSRMNFSNDAPQNLADLTLLYDFPHGAGLGGEEWQGAAGYTYTGDGDGHAHLVSFRLTVSFENSQEWRKRP